jgi:flagellar biosynthesis protein FliQ
MNQLKHVLNLAKRSRLDLAMASPLFLVVMIVGIIIS